MPRSKPGWRLAVTGVAIVLLSVLLSAQTQPAAKPEATGPATAPAQLTIPAGTKVPLALRHAISTRGSREGDAVYAETTFPLVINDRVLIPTGTYVQGRISHIQRGGKVKGRAEVLMHFTTLIYPSGYTVMLPGALENAPGVDKTKVSDSEGTIRADSQTAQKVGTVAGPAATGALIGAAASGAKGMAIGGAAGAAVGTAIALLTRGNDVKMDAGTSVEMVIQRDIQVDASRVPNSTRSAPPAQ
jgi:type IV secretion system protein VirB10